MNDILNMKTKLLVVVLLFLAFRGQALDYTITPTSKSMTVMVPVGGLFLGEGDNYSINFFIERGDDLICVGRNSAINQSGSVNVTIFGDDGVNPGMYDGEEFKIIYYLGAPNGCEIFINAIYQDLNNSTYVTDRLVVIDWMTYNTGNMGYDDDSVCVSSTLTHLPAYNSVHSYMGYQYNSTEGLVDVDLTTGGYKTIPESVGIDTIRLTLIHSDNVCFLSDAYEVIRVEENRTYSIDEYLVNKSDQSCDGFGEIELDYTGFPYSVFTTIINGDEEPYSYGSKLLDAPYGDFEINIRDAASCIHEADQLVSVEFVGECEEDLILMSDNGPTSIYFEKEELVSIYTKKGILVHQFQGPGYWDGKKSDGEAMNIGLYIIYSETGETKRLKVYQ